MFTLEEIKEAAEKHNVINSGFAVKNDGNVSEIKNEERVNSAVLWIKQHMIMQDKFSNLSSYGLKHICEYDIGYISNGEFIVAAILAGYVYQRLQQFRSTNCCFNMNESRINYLKERKNRLGMNRGNVSVTAEEIAWILDRYPLLNCFGYDVNTVRDVDGMTSDLHTRRVELINQYAAVNTCANWIAKHMEPIKHVSQYAHSYELKHIAEKEIGYMPQGVFIVAATACGHRHNPEADGAFLSIGKRSIDCARQRSANLAPSQILYPKNLFDFQKTFK